MKHIWIMSYTVFALGLGACATKVMPQAFLEPLPSNKDQISKLLSADLKSYVGPDSFIFDPKSKKYICAAELVERQILRDAKALLDYQVDPSSHRIFLTVTGRKTYHFASVRIVKPDELTGYFEPFVGLEYQIKDGCDSILSVRRDDY